MTLLEMARRLLVRMNMVQEPVDSDVEMEASADRALRNLEANRERGEPLTEETQTLLEEHREASAAAARGASGFVATGQAGLRVPAGDIPGEARINDKVRVENNVFVLCTAETEDQAVGRISAISHDGFVTVLHAPGELPPSPFVYGREAAQTQTALSQEQQQRQQALMGARQRDLAGLTGSLAPSGLDFQQRRARIAQERAEQEAARLRALNAGMNPGPLPDTGWVGPVPNTGPYENIQAELSVAKPSLAGAKLAKPNRKRKIIRKKT